MWKIVREEGDFLADPEWVRLDPCGDVRQQLVDACRSSRVVVCGDTAGRFRVSAEEIRAAALEVGANGNPFGLRLGDAHVAGQLDLRAATIPAPLHLLGCTFEEAPAFEGAELHELVIAAIGPPVRGLPLLRPSQLPGLLASGVRTKRDLVLYGSTIRGAHRTTASLTKSSAVWLTEAQIGGRLLAVGTVIDATGDRAMQCDRTSVAGDIRLVQGFTASGEVRLLAIRLGGSLDLTAARLLPDNFRALDLAEATVGGSVFILDDPDQGHRPRIHGRIEMGRTVINGRVLIRNADLRSPPPGSGLHDYNPAERDTRPFLLAPRLTVHGEFAVEPESVVHGGIALSGAELNGGVRMDGVRLWNAGGTALDLSQATLGAGLRLTEALIEGTVSIADARIRGPLDLSAAHLNHPATTRRCLDGVGVAVEGDVRMPELDTRGGSVNFRGARLAGVVEAERASLNNPGGRTLSLHQARVAGNVRLCEKFRSNGLIVLTRAVIEGRLRCDDAALAWAEPPAALNPRAAAFEAISATFRSGVSLGWTVEVGAVVFTDAQTTFLADRPDKDWPEESFLSGFTYRRYAAPDNESGPGVWEAEARIRWLHGLRPFDPGSWGQVAQVLYANGDQAGAEKVLIARGRYARRHRIGFERWSVRYVSDLMLDLLTGYGHRPLRALAVLVVLVGVVAGVLTLPGNAARMRATAGNAVYSPTARIDPMPQRMRCGGGNVRCFNPWFYGIDTVVPVVDLKQRSTWYPDSAHGSGWLEVLLNACTILGWAASTVFLLSFTRLGRAGP